MIKQNPFSLYDFLGYFIPGALFIYIYLFIDYLQKLCEKFEVKAFIQENIDVRIDKFLFFVIISYAIGHLINFLSSITIEKYANWKYNYPSKYLLGLEYSGYLGIEKRIAKFWRIVLALLLFPITLLDYIIGEILGFKNFYTRTLDKFLIDLIKMKSLKLINRLADGQLEDFKGERIRDYDFFRVILHYSFEHTKAHQFKMVNYVVLYGFLRSLSFITVLTFWYTTYKLLMGYLNLNTFVLIIIISIVSYIFFMAFMKFYRRYTLEGLMLIAINEDLK